MKRVLTFLGVVLVIALAPGLIVQLCVAVSRALVRALAQVLGVQVG